MPSKKKKYNARFPAGRIKKIMQTDEEVGKVAQAVPIIISRTLELFVESLLTKSTQITISRNAKTLTPSHMKQCILSESRFDFLKDLVNNIPDASTQEDNENNLLFDSGAENRESTNVSGTASYTKQTSHDENKISSTVIRYGPSMSHDGGGATASSSTTRRTSLTRVSRRNSNNSKREKPSSTHSAEDDLESDENSDSDEKSAKMPKLIVEDVPPLIPLLSQCKNDVLVIDEDYDN